MAITLLGSNTAAEFRKNTYQFQWDDRFDAYKQTINPMITYTDNPQKAHDIRDVFAKQRNGNEYVIIKYSGTNLIPRVRAELAQTL